MVFCEWKFDFTHWGKVSKCIGVDECLDHVTFIIKETLLADLEDDFAHFGVTWVGLEPEPDLVIGIRVVKEGTLVEHWHCQHLFVQQVNISAISHAFSRHSCQPFWRLDQVSGFLQVEQLWDFTPVRLAVVYLRCCALDAQPVSRYPVASLAHWAYFPVECDAPCRLTAVFDSCGLAVLVVDAWVEVTWVTDGEVVWRWFVFDLGVGYDGLCFGVDRLIICG